MAAAKEKLRKVRLGTKPSLEELRGLQLGDVVYLDGIVYTAREGVYKKVIEDGQEPPVPLADLSGVNFHCSPAASIDAEGNPKLTAVTATASFRFSKWLEQWFSHSGAKIIIGKGGMSEKDYKRYFVPNGAVYLTTVGYGTGALLGRGVKRIRAVHWHQELGIAQAMWILEVEDFGPFIVASDLDGNSLFDRENAKIAANLPAAYAGTRPAIMQRYGETDDRSDEVI
ncbi:MAG: fumarate hydratase C-terminal domain-containing protein [Kiloniellaceae bacterium]